MLEVLSDRENTRALLGYIREAAPALHRALIAERDLYMGRALREALCSRPEAQRIVAVVGLAHMDGIEAQFSKERKPLACGRKK